MKKNVIASVAKQPLAVISAACLLVACGDTVENVYQSGMEVVASADDLRQVIAGDVQIHNPTVGTNHAFQGLTSAQIHCFNGGIADFQSLKIRKKFNSLQVPKVEDIAHQIDVISLCQFAHIKTSVMICIE